jgi:hypothetical protein
MLAELQGAFPSPNPIVEAYEVALQPQLPSNPFPFPCNVCHIHRVGNYYGGRSTPYLYSISYFVLPYIVVTATEVSLASESCSSSSSLGGWRGAALLGPVDYRLSSIRYITYFVALCILRSSSTTKHLPTLPTPCLPCLAHLAQLTVFGESSCEGCTP